MNLLMMLRELQHKFETESAHYARTGHQERADALLHAAQTCLVQRAILYQERGLTLATTILGDTTRRKQRPAYPWRRGT